MRWRAALILLSVLTSAPFGGLAASAQDAPSSESDYSRDASWLCRPGRDDVCAAPSTLASIAPDGASRVESFDVSAAAALDCFYVYPTISEAPSDLSPLTAGPGELRAAEQQFRPFASVCRPFAPLYRQVTVAGLGKRMRGLPFDGDPQTGYRDVLAAWRHYLAHDNQGRRVVLIGHSQGARVLADLIRQEIDGKPDQSRLAGAILLGYNVETPPGLDVGGRFQHLPVCSEPRQSGCLIAYESFRTTATPVAGSPIGFGFAKTPGMTLACADPTKLSGKPLEMAIPLKRNLLGQPAAEPRWTTLAAKTEATFVDLPGLISVRCIKDEHGAYLAVERRSDAAGAARPDDIPGDFVMRGRRFDDWGLHLVDVNLAMGNLVEIVRGWR